MPAGHLEPDEVVTAERGIGLVEIAQKLKLEIVGAVVIAENDEPVGIVTDRDISLALAESDDVSSFTAADVMTEDPVTLQEDEGVSRSRGLSTGTTFGGFRSSTGTAS